MIVLPSLNIDKYWRESFNNNKTGNFVTIVLGVGIAQVHITEFYSTENKSGT